MTKGLLPTLALLLFAGCNSANHEGMPADLLYRTVPVPERFLGGDPWPGYDRELKRFTYAYESGWRNCVDVYARKIGHQACESDKMGNGWPAELDGYWKGFSDAENRVRSLIKRLGKAKAQETLKKALLSPEM
ncbi:MAG: hypothetical protein QM691_10995 [Opitutaceae bacterium]